MATVLKIKRSSGTTAPSALAQGELALTYGAGTQANNGDRLFIGTGAETGGEAAAIDVIGGQYFTAMLDHAAGTLTASSALLVDANSKIDNFNVDDININGSTISSTDTNGDVTITPHGSGDIVLDGVKWPQADGSANQLLQTDGNGQAAWATSANTITLAADSGSNDTYTTGATLTFAGGTGLASTVSNDNISYAIDATVATLTGSQTLTNKTLTSPVLNTATAGTSLTMLEDATIIFEGATDDTAETTLTVVDPTTDRIVSLPNATDTLVGKATTDTLTNKTITSAVLNAAISGTSIKDEDNMSSDSASHLVTQQSVKAYVDAQVTAQDLDFQGDSGGALSIDLDSETLDIAGGTGVDTVGSSNTVTVSIDSTVATLTGSQTLTNKTLTAPVVNTATVGTSITPAAADGATLGTAALEWGDLFLADGGTVTFGNDQEIVLAHAADNGLTLKHASTSDDKYPTFTLQTGDDDIAVSDKLGVINFQAPSEGAGTDAILVAAGIEAVSEGNFAADNNATKLVFKTAASEAAASKMTISSAGVVNVSATTASSSATTGAVTVGGGLGVAADVNVGDDLTLRSDSAVLGFGADLDTTLTHTDGSGLTMNSTNKIMFNDASQFIHGSSNAILSLGATDEIDLTATTIDINGAVAMDGALTGVASVAVDNLLLNGNSITTTDTNGDMVISPHGSGVVNVDTSRITNVTDPTGAQDAATKSYVDAVKTGLDVKDSVVMATTASLGYTYNNGSSGVGATFTAAGNGAVTIDGIATDTVNERILVKDEADSEENGIYYVSTASAVGATLVLTRATDSDTATEFNGGAFTFVEQGTVNADSGWVMTQDTAITFGSTGVTWAQFSGAGQVTAGAGMTKSANTLNVIGTASRIVVAADAVNIATDYVGQNTLTTLGTITTGTWAATDVGVAHGGTGLSAVAKGSILVANSANTLTALDGGGSDDGILAYTASADTIAWATSIDGGTF